MKKKLKLKWKILLAVIVVLFVIFLLALTGVIQADFLKEMWDENPLLTIILAPVLLMIWLGNKLAGKKKEDVETLSTDDTTKEDVATLFTDDTTKEYDDWLVENYPEYKDSENVLIVIDVEAETVTYYDNYANRVIAVDKVRLVK